MADNTINVRIKDRSDTEANWTSKNPVLLKGERAITDGTGKYKIGDGKNTWSALPYYEAMTSADRTKLNGIASGANKTTVDSSLSSSSTNPVQNKVVNSALAGKSNTSHTHDLSTMINTLSIGSSTPTDDDYFVSQYAGGGTTTTTYHRRPVKALLEYIKGKFAKVATSGSYNDLSNKPTIPSVGNGTITIKQAGAVKGSFTTNQSGATTIELTDNNTNTWRDVIDNLTSTATDKSLSAKQGKLLNDNKAEIREWSAQIKCATWSRLCYVEQKGSVIGSSFILNISGTRNAVVYNDTFVIKVHHSQKATISKISGSTYSTGIQVRVVSDSSGNCYVEMYENVNGATNTTTQIVYCSLINIACGAITTYTSFTNGASIPTGFTSNATITTNSNSLQGNLTWGEITGKPAFKTIATSGSYNDLSNKPTIGNGTVTITQGGTSKGTFTLNQTGNTTIALTDNNTWRGIQNNLTSTSTTDSLSAAQGKVLNDKFASYVPTSRTVNGKALSANISLNASDVGASASGHTHNYAGSSSAGGAALSSNAVNNIFGGSRQTSGNIDFTNSAYVNKVTYILATSTMTTGKPPTDGHILSFGWDTSAGWGAQMSLGNSSGNHLYIRGAASKDNKTTYEDWKTILDSSNYNIYTPTKTGGGASGTWGISITGNAATATKLGTSAGSATQPVYFSGGKPVAGTYTLGNACSKTTRTLKTAGNSGWKDASTDSNYVPDMSFIAYWNGAYSSSGDSNLAYCNKGAFGTAATKNTDYFATAGHTHNYVKDAGNNSSNTTFAYSKAGMNYGDYAWLAGWNGYELRAVSKSQFATAGHTHNYAGSSSAGGSANSAVKLATARSVSNTEDFVMSFSYDGSANSNASLRYYNSRISIGNTNNYPYHRFAKIDTQTSSYIDKTSTFLITQDYNGGGWGIVRISLRTNNSSSVSTVEAKWLVRCGLDVDCIQIGLYNVFGKTYADAFFKTSGTYTGTVIRNLASGARGNISRTWILTDSAEANSTTTSDKKTSTESYASTSAAATTLHSQAYTSIVVASDGGTVSYANSAGNASKVNNHTVNSNVPSGAKFTDTVYSHPTTSGNKHIPSGGSSGQILRWSSDGTAVWGNDNNTTYTLSSITGTLAVSKGGTGSTTAAGGRSNLGAVGFVCQSAEPSGQNNGDLWFKEE